MIEVRPARAADVPGAARLAAELVRLHHRLDFRRFLLVEPVEEGYARFLRTQVAREGTVFLVGVRGEAVVGYLLGGLEDRNWMDLRDACGKLYDLYVDPPARGGGLGGRLVREGVALLAALGAPRVVLMTAWENPEAHRLFERLGFRRTMLEMTTETGDLQPTVAPVRSSGA